VTRKKKFEAEKRRERPPPDTRKRLETRVETEGKGGDSEKTTRSLKGNQGDNRGN